MPIISNRFPQICSPLGLGLNPLVMRAGEAGSSQVCFSLRGAQTPPTDSEPHSVADQLDRLGMRGSRSEATWVGCCELEALENEAADLPLAALLLDTLRAHATLAPAPQLMGVLNVTPDSFSDGGRFLHIEAALDQGRRLAAEGAAVLDVGGESTRPGAQPVCEEEEMQRVLPVIRGLAAELPIPLSIDTTKASVAQAALEAGASWVNDVSGCEVDGRMLSVVAEYGARVVLMHSQGTPQEMQANPAYENPTEQVAHYLRSRAAACIAAGVDPAQILIDPGIGFGKRLKHNVSLLRELPVLRSLGLPVLVGVSRKSFIGHIMGSEDQTQWQRGSAAQEPQERLGGTAAALGVCVLGGAEYLRVHDVAVMAEAASVAAALRPHPEAQA